MLMQAGLPRRQGTRNKVLQSNGLIQLRASEGAFPLQKRLLYLPDHFSPGGFLEGGTNEYRSTYPCRAQSPAAATSWFNSFQKASLG